jgi:hypothetical protein
MTIQKIAQSVVNEDENLYVNASDKPLTADGRRWVTQLVSAVDYDSVSHYGNCLNFVRPEQVVNAEDIGEEVIDALMRQHDNDELTPSLDRTIENSNRDELVELINPSDIIDTAGLWDDKDFVDWFFSTFDYGFVRTDDGAVMNINIFKGEINSVDSLDFEETIEDLF